MAQRFVDIIIGYAQGNLVLTALFSAAIVWVVGLAVPGHGFLHHVRGDRRTGPHQVRVPDLAGQMSIFYCAVLAEVSPPTADRKSTRLNSSH